MRNWTKHEESMIHEVMKMAYEQGREQGKEEAIRNLAKKVSDMREEKERCSNE